MANENVKIIVQEVNETTPRGSGVSSDIAYVPGLAVESAISKNTPVLCNTIAEFEANFGAEPYIMTANDVNIQLEHKYNIGDYDKSYVYAKELINAGMSVIYENITAESEFKNIAAVNFIPSGNTEDAQLVDNKNNSFTYTAKSEDTLTYNFKFKVTGNPLFGSTTIILKTPDDPKVVATLSDIEVDPAYAPKFTIISETNTIKWQQLSETDLEYAIFSVRVNIKNTNPNESGKKQKAPVTFNIYVVEGEAVNANGVVAGSKIEYLYEMLPERLNVIEDKNEYSVKYVTSGGYPTFIEIRQNDGSKTYSLADALVDCAYQRGDAVALVDPIDNPDDPLRCTDENSVYYKANQFFGSGQ